MSNRMLGRQTTRVSIDWDETSLGNVASNLPSEPSSFSRVRTRSRCGYGTTDVGIGPVDPRGRSSATTGIASSAFAMQNHRMNNNNINNNNTDDNSRPRESVATYTTHRYEQMRIWREIQAHQDQNRIENGRNGNEVDNTNNILYNSNSGEHIGSVAHRRSSDDSNDLNRYGNVARLDSSVPAGEVDDAELAVRLARQEILSEEDHFESALQKAIELSKLECSQDQMRRHRNSLQEAVTLLPRTDDHSPQRAVQKENIADAPKHSHHQSELKRDAKLPPHSDEADTESQVYAKQLEEALLLSVARDQEYQRRLEQEEKELRMAMTLSIARYTAQHDGLSQHTAQENMGRGNQEDLDGFDARLNCEPQRQIMNEEQHNQVHGRQAHEGIIQEDRDNLGRDSLKREFWSAKSLSGHRQESEQKVPYCLAQSNQVQQEQQEEEGTQCNEEKEITNMLQWDERSSPRICDDDEISIRLEKQIQATVTKKMQLQEKIEGNLRRLEQYKRSSFSTLGTDSLTSRVAEQQHQEKARAEHVQQETQHSDQFSEQDETQQVQQDQGEKTNVGSAMQTSSSMDSWLQKKQIDIATFPNNSDIPVHQTSETGVTEETGQTGETGPTGAKGKTGETAKTGDSVETEETEETRKTNNQNTSSMDSWLKKKQNNCWAHMGGSLLSLQSSEVPSLASHQTPEQLKEARHRQAMLQLEHQRDSFRLKDAAYETTRDINYDSLAVLLPGSRRSSFMTNSDGPKQQINAVNGKNALDHQNNKNDSSQAARTTQEGDDINIEIKQRTFSKDNWLQKTQRDSLAHVGGGSLWTLQTSEVPTLACKQNQEQANKVRQQQTDITQPTLASSSHQKQKDIHSDRCFTPEKRQISSQDSFHCEEPDMKYNGEDPNKCCDKGGSISSLSYNTPQPPQNEKKQNEMKPEDSSMPSTAITCATTPSSTTEYVIRKDFEDSPTEIAYEPLLPPLRRAQTMVQPSKADPLPIRRATLAVFQRQEPSSLKITRAMPVLSDDNSKLKNPAQKVPIPQLSNEKDANKISRSDVASRNESLSPTVLRPRSCPHDDPGDEVPRHGRKIPHDDPDDGVSGPGYRRRKRFGSNDFLGRDGNSVYMRNERGGSTVGPHGGVRTQNGKKNTNNRKDAASLVNTRKNNNKNNRNDSRTTDSRTLASGLAVDRKL